ncbi:MAG: hypothetical protein LAO30_06030 [Acidobacteriia bacterium]|nr:hypothetical protein [Terriglobia bacterium]
MRKKGPTNHFWLVLGTLNVLVMVYPIVLVCRADRVDAQLLATFVLIVAILLLAVADTISILVADVIGGTNRGDKQRKIRPD